RIVAKALSKEAHDRYSSVNDMADDLRAVLAEISASPHVPGKTRSRWYGAIGAAALAALIVSIGLLPSMRRVLFNQTSSPAAALDTAFDWVKQGRTYLQRYDR